MSIGRFFAAAGMAAIVSFQALPVHAEADGPDAWRVTGVAPHDVLNMRMGPGTGYMVIGSLGPYARGLKSITCVPLLSMQIWDGLSEAQRAALPSRWCLVQHPESGQSGWIAGRFMTED